MLVPLLKPVKLFFARKEERRERAKEKKRNDEGYKKERSYNIFQECKYCQKCKKIYIYIYINKDNNEEKLSKTKKLKIP